MNLIVSMLWFLNLQFCFHGHRVALTLFKYWKKVFLSELRFSYPWTALNTHPQTVLGSSTLPEHILIRNTWYNNSVDLFSPLSLIISLCLQSSSRASETSCYWYLAETQYCNAGRNSQRLMSPQDGLCVLFVSGKSSLFFFGYSIGKIGCC